MVLLEYGVGRTRRRAYGDGGEKKCDAAWRGAARCGELRITEIEFNLIGQGRFPTTRFVF